MFKRLVYIFILLITSVECMSASRYRKINFYIDYKYYENEEYSQYLVETIIYLKSEILVKNVPIVHRNILDSLIFKLEKNPETKEKLKEKVIEKLNQYFINFKDNIENKLRKFVDSSESCLNLTF